MSEVTITVGEVVYEYKARFTKIVEYGVDTAEIMAGRVAPPPEGARFDAHFEAVCTGKIAGTLTGIDYLNIRADGRMQLHVHGEITTNDGHKIALFVDGVAGPEEGKHLWKARENVTLTTSSPAYSWVNRLQMWIQGTYDPDTMEGIGKVFVA